MYSPFASVHKQVPANDFFPNLPGIFEDNLDNFLKNKPSLDIASGLLSTTLESELDLDIRLLNSCVLFWFFSENGYRQSSRRRLIKQTSPVIINGCQE